MRNADVKRMAQDIEQDLIAIGATGVRLDSGRAASNSKSFSGFSTARGAPVKPKRSAASAKDPNGDGNGDGDGDGNGAKDKGIRVLHCKVDMKTIRINAPGVQLLPATAKTSTDSKETVKAPENAKAQKKKKKKQGSKKDDKEDSKPAKKPGKTKKKKDAKVAFQSAPVAQHEESSSTSSAMAVDGAAEGTTTNADASKSTSVKGDKKKKTKKKQGKKRQVDEVEEENAQQTTGVASNETATMDEDEVAAVSTEASEARTARVALAQRSPNVKKGKNADKRKGSCTASSSESEGGEPMMTTTNEAEAAVPSSPQPVPSAAALKKLKVADLKTLLSEKGVKPMKLKNDMIVQLLSMSPTTK